MVTTTTTTTQRSTSTVKVLMLPWLAYGHISPFLELAKNLISSATNDKSFHFHIYLCSTPVNLSSIKQNLPAKYSHSIEFVELHLPSLPELPPHHHTTNGLPPHLMSTLKKAFNMSSTPNFSTILKTLDPDLFIYDFLKPWAPALALSLNIPSVCFLTTGAGAAVSTIETIMLDKYSLPDKKFPFPALDELIKMEDDLDGYFQWVELYSGSFLMIKSFRELEGKYIDDLIVLTNKKIVPVGPLVQEHDQEDNSTNMEILAWLDKKERCSTILVSFGTEYFLTKEEMEEIAEGIEQSKVGFIWVVRFPASGDERVMMSLEDSLPYGFLEKVGERGRVLEGWAPQTRILGHPSIGGFVSHCGWSSVMESMKLGVPVIAMPMHLDQPVNARLVEEVGVGVEVKRGENGRIEREEVARVIREVVVERNGEKMRKQAREMSESIRRKGDEEIGVVVDELVKLCGTRNFH